MNHYLPLFTIPHYFWFIVIVLYCNVMQIIIHHCFLATEFDKPVKSYCKEYIYYLKKSVLFDTLFVETINTVVVQ